MTTTTSDARTRLRRLGQADLGSWIQVATDEPLWSIQKRIASAISKPNARVNVPSCVASGKTFLAARIALAFYDSYQPGTPCDICGGPCGGAIVITTSSTEEHLKNNLWGEIRIAWSKIRERYGIDGTLPPADTWISHEPKHYITGLVATKPEGFQGYHAAHILIIGDEATAVDEAVARGITGVLSTGDSRLLLIYNPTDTSTYAAQQSRAKRTEMIRIRAFDTPGFTGEPYPPGANLITQLFLDDLTDQGMGPGTFEWTTRVLAQFWDLSDDTLVAEKWYDDAKTGLLVPGERALGIDLAPYGSSESIIAFRDGNTLSEIAPFPAGRVDLFFQGPVTDYVRRYQPDLVVYDADGVGAGAVGEAEALKRFLPDGARVIGFRGAKKVAESHTNARSLWYWHLRRLFQAGELALGFDDPTFREQITNIRYSLQGGAIRVETKDEMKKRGFKSPDRADGAMYAFAFSGPVTSMPVVRPEHNVDSAFNVRDNRERAMWERDLRRNEEPTYHPVLGVSDW